MKRIIPYLIAIALVSVWQAAADQSEQDQKLRRLIDRLERGADVSKRTATNEWGVATNNVQLSICLKGAGNQIRTNEPFGLMLDLKNVSTNETFFFDYSTGEAFWPGFECAVTTPSAKEARLNLTAPVGQKNSGQIVCIPPNQTREVELRLSRVFNFDEIGNYKLIAMLTLLSPSTQKPFTVVSNPLLFSVAPD